MYSSLGALQIPQHLLMYRTNTTEESFLLHDSGPLSGAMRFLVIGVPRNVDFLKHSTIWMADGTFKVAPWFFVQLYAPLVY